MHWLAGGQTYNLSPHINQISRSLLKRPLKHQPNRHSCHRWWTRDWFNWSGEFYRYDYSRQRYYRTVEL